jgi:Na+-driven multidrug efflux pump
VTTPRISRSAQGRQDYLGGLLADPKRGLRSLVLGYTAMFALDVVYLVGHGVLVRRLDDAAVGASVLGGGVLATYFAVTQGFSTTIVTLVSRAIGAEQRSDARRIVAGMLSLALAVASILVVCLALWDHQLARMLGAEKTVYEHTLAYFSGLRWAVIPTLLAVCAQASFVALGAIRTAVVAQAALLLPRLALEAALMHGAGWGLAATGFAAGAAGVVALLVYCVLLSRTDLLPAATDFLRAPRDRLLGSIFSVGVPRAGEMFLFALGTVALSASVARYGGVALAGYAAASRVEALIQLPILGFSAATLQLVAACLGAKQSARAVEVLKYAWRFSVAVCFGMAIVAYLSSPWTLHVFVQAEDSVNIGSTYLAYLIVAGPMRAVGVASMRTYQAADRGWTALAAFALRTAIGVAGVFLVVRLGAPIFALWASFAIADALAGLTCARYSLRFLESIGASGHTDPAPDPQGARVAPCD